MLTFVFEASSQTMLPGPKKGISFPRGFLGLMVQSRSCEKLFSPVQR